MIGRSELSSLGTVKRDGIIRLCHPVQLQLPKFGYLAAMRAFPEMVPELPSDDGVAVSRRAAAFWVREWTGRSMMAVGAQDPVFTPARMEELRHHIRGCPPPMLVAQGGHFVQEHGAVIAAHAMRQLPKRPRHRFGRRVIAPASHHRPLWAVCWS